jgi:hypothetical protein
MNKYTPNGKAELTFNGKPIGEIKGICENPSTDELLPLTDASIKILTGCNQWFIKTAAPVADE